MQGLIPYEHRVRIGVWILQEFLIQAHPVGFVVVVFVSGSSAFLCFGSMACSDVLCIF